VRKHPFTMKNIMKLPDTLLSLMYCWCSGKRVVTSPTHNNHIRTTTTTTTTTRKALESLVEYLPRGITTQRREENNKQRREEQARDKSFKREQQKQSKMAEVLIPPRLITLVSQHFLFLFLFFPKGLLFFSLRSYCALLLPS